MLRSTMPPKHSRGVFVDDRDDLDRPPVGGGIELEVHRPHPIGRIRDDRRRCGRGAAAFSASPLWHPKPFLTPKPLDLLVIDDPAFGAGVMIGGPEPTARMILGVGAQPVPQGGVGIVGGIGGGFVSLGGAVLPGHAAGEPLADPQHTLEMTNGCPPAFRA
jgi:hypothetical protein